MLRRLGLLVIVLGMVCFVALPQGSAQNLNKAWVQRMAELLVENQVAEGLSLGYIEGQHWGIVHLGHANRKKEKANNHTVYELGSISKVFTSLLLADAVVRGEIDLESPIDVANEARIQMPSFDNRKLRWVHLSTHRSGLPRLPSNRLLTNPTNPYRNYDSKKAAAFLKDYKLSRQPGATQEYSNFGVSVLGYLVAENAGKTYQELLTERIANPLQLKDCTVTLSKDQRKRLALPHNKFGSATARWTFADLPGAGGVHASMRDMMRFAKAQLEPPSGNLGKAIELAWQEHTEADASGPAMGLGWHILGDGQTRWHNGQTGGSHSALFINREIKTAVVVLCNTAVSEKIDQLAVLMLRKAGGKAEQGSNENNYLKRAPFTGVRWKEQQPEVQVDQEWYELIALNDIPTAEILAFGKKTFGNKWQMRFEEDLVELLSRMGHPPQDTVKLVLRSLNSREIKTLEQVPMTEANRRAVKSEMAREAPQENLAIDAKLRSRLEGRYKLTPNFIFTVRDRNGRLMVSITNQPTLEVFPDSPIRWSYRSVKATLEFNLPKTGSAQSLVLHQNGMQQVAKRMK